MNSPSFIKFLVLKIAIPLLSGVWILGFFIPFLIDSIDIIFAAQNIFSAVCHQDTQKSICYNGMRSLVCARCAGIYIGIFVMSLILPTLSVLRFKSNKIILLAALPMIIDSAMVKLSFYEYSQLTAAATGFLFGSAIFLYIYDGLNNLIRYFLKGAD